MLRLGTDHTMTMLMYFLLFIFLGFIFRVYISVVKTNYTNKNNILAMF